MEFGGASTDAILTGLLFCTEVAFMLNYWLNIKTTQIDVALS